MRRSASDPRIRHFGVMANHERSESIALCRKMLEMTPLVRAIESRLPNPTWLCPRCQAAHDRHRQADSSSTLLDIFSPSLHRFFVNVSPTEALDVYEDASANVCPPATIRSVLWSAIALDVGHRGAETFVSHPAGVPTSTQAFHLWTTSTRILVLSP
jgi:hypothetical protein